MSQFQKRNRPKAPSYRSLSPDNLKKEQEDSDEVFPQNIFLLVRFDRLADYRLLADEPTGNLDSVTATAILDLFRDMANRGTTVVIATHEADIARVIDRRIEISDGKIQRA